MPVRARLEILASALGLAYAAAASAAPPPGEFFPEDYTLLGAAVRTRPAYDGSASQRTDLIPIVRYYGHPFFARTTQGVLEGGARGEIVSGLVYGAQIAYEAG